MGRGAEQNETQPKDTSIRKEYVGHPPGKRHRHKDSRKSGKDCGDLEQGAPTSGSAEHRTLMGLERG